MLLPVWLTLLFTTFDISKAGLIDVSSVTTAVTSTMNGVDRTSGARNDPPATRINCVRNCDDTQADRESRQTLDGDGSDETRRIMDVANRFAQRRGRNFPYVDDTDERNISRMRARLSVGSQRVNARFVDRVALISLFRLAQESIESNSTVRLVRTANNKQATNEALRRNS